MPSLTPKTPPTVAEYRLGANIFLGLGLTCLGCFYFLKESAFTWLMVTLAIILLPRGFWYLYKGWGEGGR